MELLKSILAFGYSRAFQLSYKLISNRYLFKDIIYETTYKTIDIETKNGLGSYYRRNI